MKLRPSNSWLVALFIVVMIGVTYGTCWRFGRGGKIYFSKDTLARSHQREVLVPIANISLWRGPTQTYRSALAKYLIEEGHWLPQPDTSEPVVVSHWNFQWRDGDSDFFREMNRGERYIDWTEANPVFAAKFWPTVLERLRTNEDAIHSEVPALMRYAVHCSSDAELRRQLSKTSDIEW